MSQGRAVNVRFCSPPPELRRYFTTFYLTEWTLPEGQRLTDYLLPEWANLRFITGDCPDAETQSRAKLTGSNFPATGPSSEAIRFTIGSSRAWGIGLLPLGWAKFVGVPAAGLANQIVDGNSHPAFASFVPLARTVFDEQPDPEGELARITRHFLDRIDEPITDEERILAIHAALLDRDTSNVTDMVESTGTSQRTLERLCKRHFGFSPKLLLRRQRFMRSLSDFVVDPSLKWIGAMDGRYHDQAQFVRDFRQFTGMTPRQYAAFDKPLLGEVMRERARFTGSPVQTLDSPLGGGMRG